MPLPAESLFSLPVFFYQNLIDIFKLLNIMQ